MKVEFWFDFGSTYSYPAALRVESLAAAAGVPVLWRPFVLGAVFKRQGLATSPYKQHAEMERYMWRDVARVCSDLGVPFNRPRRFPQNGLLGARVVARCAEAPWVSAFVRELFAANFEHDLDIALPDTVAHCLRCVGADAADVIDSATTEQAKLALRVQTDAAMALGVFGAPTLRVGDELFWGNDRLEQALRWAVDVRTGGNGPGRDGEDPQPRG
ncbi:MAG: 2-hydroxychromene-2-carboxylate isomerase [Pseudomonadota bacterium]